MGTDRQTETHTDRQTQTQTQTDTDTDTHTIVKTLPASVFFSGLRRVAKREAHLFRPRWAEDTY